MYAAPALLIATSEPGAPIAIVPESIATDVPKREFA